MVPTQNQGSILSIKYSRYQVVPHSLYILEKHRKCDSVYASLYNTLSKCINQVHIYITNTFNIHSLELTRNEYSLPLEYTTRDLGSDAGGWLGTSSTFVLYNKLNCLEIFAYL